MKAQAQVAMTVATDDDLKDILWKYTDEALNTIIRTDLTTHSAGVARLASTDLANHTVPFGDVAVGALLFISTDVEVTVLLNAGAEAITIKPSGSYRGMLFLHGAFTSAIITKPTTGTANVRYCVVGEEA